MSLGGGASTRALDTAVRNSIAAGVTYAVAAGNEQRRTPATHSPARVRRGDHGRRHHQHRTPASSFSNYGTCLDIFAPGSQHHLGLVHQQHRHQHHQRHVDGDAARRPAPPRCTCRRTRGHAAAGARRSS